MKELPNGERRHWVGVLLPRLTSPDHPDGPIFLIFAGNSFTGDGLFFDITPWFWAVFGSMILSSLLWFPLVRGITRNVRETLNATERLARGDFDVRVSEARGDELGRLGQAVNRMATQLDGYVRGQRRFMGDIAHELCSPIARMEMGLGILENQVPDAQQERLGEVRAELRELSVMVSELLAFSKNTHQLNSAAQQSIPLLPLVEAAAQREAVPADQLRINIDPSLSVKAHPELLSRAVGNLLRNSLLHAPGSSIHVTASTKRDRVTLLVRDEGPGVPADSIARLFEPFYRVDIARTRESGGTGLGLAIVKTCIESCNGTVTARNHEHGGLEIEVELDLATQHATTPPKGEE
jgi:two-component system sensor histidine kinase CpxA